MNLTGDRFSPYYRLIEPYILDVEGSEQLDRLKNSKVTNLKRFVANDLRRQFIHTLGRAHSKVWITDIEFDGYIDGHYGNIIGVGFLFTVIGVKWVLQLLASSQITRDSIHMIIPEQEWDILGTPDEPVKA